ncbi:flagellar protein FlaG [Candidatus Enterovibrio escicola]|uniref:Flagellin protein FlaG n=3 Tax=Candidatus Enterovibrio escicola TaxID=1927127 RepID=A0A2A5T1H8_9GAMM|nr:flagellar protein FlaG [Candidatus Enterovibrio escacola]PCS21978.1 Flagellin protein FlaG [Candidatus Enterovibrio escacola]
MELMSVSTPSLSHVTPMSDTKVISKKQYVEGAPLGITHQQQMAENTEKLIQNRVEKIKRLEGSQEIQQEHLERLLEQLDEFVSTFNTGLSFRLDEESGKNIITVYEMSSGDIIRQIPEKAMLELAQQLSLHARGLVAEKV